VLSRGIGRVFQVLLFFGVVVSAYFVWRMTKVEPGSMAPSTDLRKAVDTYQQRMRQTERILKTDRL
jgi:hypothetical protein